MDKSLPKPTRAALPIRVGILFVGMCCAALLAVATPASSDTNEAELPLTLSDNPDPAHVGEELTYTVSTENLGSKPAVNFRMYASLTKDANFVSMSFSSGSGKGSCEPFDEWTRGTDCRMDEFGVGETATLQIIVRPLVTGRLAIVSDALADNGSDLTFEVSEDTEVLPPNPLGCTVFGTEGNDEEADLVGTPGDDVICALGGDDRIRGKGGNDVIHGGEGIDNLLGGGGDDVLRGGDRHDELFGGQGGDRLFGERGRDYLDASDGVRSNDFGDGGAKSDVISADPGDRVRD